jgi:hypothetical protein
MAALAGSGIIMTASAESATSFIDLFLGLARAIVALPDHQHSTAPIGTTGHREERIAGVRGRALAIQAT